MNKEEKERILKCVMEQIEKEQAPRRRIHPKRAALAALAAATIFVCGAFTANVLELDSKLIEMLGGSSEEITEAVTDINTAVEKNGLRLEVKQAVGDGHRVYAVFELTSLTDLKMDRTCGFQEYEVEWSEEYGHSGISIDAEQNSVSKDGKTLRFGVEFTMDRQVYDQNIVMRFEDFGKIFFIPKEETEVLAEGVWIIDFPLKYKKVSKTCNTDVLIQVKSGSVRLEKIDISPMSCFLEFHAAEYSEELRESWADGLHPKIRMKDGSVVSFRTRGASWTESGKTSRGTLEGNFSRLIDMEQMESLILCGEEIPLN